MPTLRMGSSCRKVTFNCLVVECFAFFICCIVLLLVAVSSEFTTEEVG